MKRFVLILSLSLVAGIAIAGWLTPIEDTSTSGTYTYTPDKNGDAIELISVHYDTSQASTNYVYLVATDDTETLLLRSGTGPVQDVFFVFQTPMVLLTNQSIKVTDVTGEDFSITLNTTREK